MLQNYIILSIVSFGISVITVPIIIRLSRRLGWFDEINDRKIHESKISRLGGLGIFLAFLVPFMVFVYFSKEVKFNINLYLAAMFIIFLTGFIDDISNIRARYKLILQIFSPEASVNFPFRQIQLHSFDLQQLLHQINYS